MLMYSFGSSDIWDNSLLRKVAVSTFIRMERKIADRDIPAVNHLERTLRVKSKVWNDSHFEHSLQNPERFHR